MPRPGYRSVNLGPDLAPAVEKAASDAKLSVDRFVRDTLEQRLTRIGLWPPKKK